MICQLNSVLRYIFISEIYFFFQKAFQRVLHQLFRDLQKVLKKFNKKYIVLFSTNQTADILACQR